MQEIHLKSYLGNEGFLICWTWHCHLGIAEGTGGIKKVQRDFAVLEHTVDIKELRATKADLGRNTSDVVYGRLRLRLTP